jgi:hypothetical protein
MVNASAFAACSTTHKAFIYFDRVFAANTIALWTDHSGPQLVQDLEGGFITGEAELPLEL